MLAVFPEGTTSDGVDLLPFHANLIQAAISAARAGAAGRRCASSTPAPARDSLAPCYIGDDTLLGSLWRTLSGPPITAVVTLRCRAARGWPRPPHLGRRPANGRAGAALHLSLRRRPAARATRACIAGYDAAWSSRKRKSSGPNAASPVAVRPA